MKKRIAILTLGCAVFAALQANAQNSVESDPAYLGIDKVLDLKTLRPEVNVNLPKFLLMDVASGFDGGPDDPFAGTGIEFGDLIREIKLVQVVVVEANDENRAELDKGVKALRAKLEADWTPIVTVPEENVGVYAMSDKSGESMAGIAVLVNDGGDAVIANVVGRVSIGKLVQVASRMDKFPKDLLKKLTGFQESGPAPQQDSEAAN